MSRAPHMLLGTDDGGMTLPPVESVVQSYASLAASLDAASFPPLTRRKPVSSPIRSHKNHRETRGRERREKKQEAFGELLREADAPCIIVTNTLSAFDAIASMIRFN